MNCINTKSKEFEELLEASKLPSLLLEMRITKWQEQNGLDNFPKVEDIVQSNEITLNNIKNAHINYKVDYIYNLHKLTRMVSKSRGMNIYLFGDYHTNKYNCEHIDNTTSVPLFILNQIKTSNDFVDLFIETPLIEKNTDKEILKRGLINLIR